MKKKSNPLAKNLIFLLLSINTVIFYAFVLKKYQEKVVEKNSQVAVPLQTVEQTHSVAKKSLK